MRNLKTVLFLILLSPLIAMCQEVKNEMRSAYMAYRALQSFMVSAELFQDPQNRDRIISLLKKLSSNFHGIDSIPSKYRDLPGFEANLKLVGQTLDDATYRLKEGKGSYAFWRLRGLSSNCTTCHTTYNVTAQFHDDGLDLKGLNDLERAEFLMASRQYDQAETAIDRALRQSSLEIDKLKLLRYLLVITTRIRPDPKSSAEKLRRTLDSIDLSGIDRNELESWIMGLEEWSKDNARELGSLVAVEALLKEGADFNKPAESSASAVKLLRATGALHALLADPKFPLSERSQALYLLGFAYSKLPFFFVDELPEFYLQRSIEESPGSASAQKAYKLYKELVTLGFTGSSGTHIPADISLRLRELYEKANRIPRLDGKI